ncbi:MAG: U32 family peptidase C-terminal domain-containing protein [Magnetovibrio sp.]|nr:U32 family peptidase C-terminal domain-containing protein [Magnetovibrio sp.]
MTENNAPHDPKHRAELLMPAGSLSKLKTAILYGADAVYAGTPDLSLRTQSDFALEDLMEGVRFVHEYGKRIYLTLNLFTHNRDIEKLPEFVKTIRKVKPDGVIVADQGVFHFLREHAPELDIHVSTQANACSWLTVKSWESMGAKLCVLAREVSFEELVEIREKCPDIKLEAFIHGAMCMTYSGRCLLSNFLAERGANQGNCAQSCRWNYKVMARAKDGSEIAITPDNKDDYDFYLEEEFRPGELMKIEEDDRGSYIMNAKDLCLMPKLDDYLKLGVDSLKVEGRNKSEYYAAVTARAYRLAIDDWYADPESWTPDPYLREIYTLQNRGYSLGFHDGRLTNIAHNYDRTDTVGGWLYAGVVERWEGDDIIFSLRNTLKPGSVIEFLSPFEIEPIRLRLYEFVNAKNGEVMEKASPGQDRAIRIPGELFHNEDLACLKKILPVCSIGRTEAVLSEDRQALLQGNLMSMDVERGLRDGNEERPTLKGRAHTGKTPALGLDACCGLGCNGCYMFWEDDKYAKAREVMKAKKIGQMLGKKEAKEAEKTDAAQ